MLNQIKQILREETKLLLNVRRRISDIDNELIMVVKNYKDQYGNMCIGQDNYIESIKELALDSIYWTYYSDIDDDSDEWNQIYEFISDYFDKKFVPKLKMDYHVNCGD